MPKERRLRKPDFTNCTKAPIHQNANTNINTNTNTDNTGDNYLGVILLQMHNRCQYLNAYKSNVTQYIYCEYMGMELHKNYCIDLVWTATWGVCQSLRCLECSQQSHILAGDDGGDDDHFDYYIRWQLLGCLEIISQPINVSIVAKKHTTALIPWPVDVQEVFEDIVGKPDYIMNVKYYTKSILIYIQNLIPFNKRVEKIEWISVASVFLLDFVKRWVRIACMYTLYTPRCFAISQVEANIKQSSGLMRALTRPNGHAGVNTLEATLHCNAKGAAVSG